MDKFARKSKIRVKLKKFKTNNENEKPQKFIVDIGVWRG